MATRAEIIAEARTWLKTPWRHQGIACKLRRAYRLRAARVGHLPADR